jgi:hypothetical protein
MHGALLRPSLVQTLQKHHPYNYAQRINLRLRPAFKCFPPHHGQNRLKQTQQRTLVSLCLNRRLCAENP